MNQLTRTRELWKLINIVKDVLPWKPEGQETTGRDKENIDRSIKRLLLKAGTSISPAEVSKYREDW